MCKHIAAVLYGVGARLDESPELLFRLRAVDETELLSDLGSALPDTRTKRDTAHTLVGDDLAALFGLDMEESKAPAAFPLGRCHIGRSPKENAQKRQGHGVEARQEEKQEGTEPTTLEEGNKKGDLPGLERNDPGSPRLSGGATEILRCAFLRQCGSIQAAARRMPTSVGVRLLLAHRCSRASASERGRLSDLSVPARKRSPHVRCRRSWSTIAGAIVSRDPKRGGREGAKVGVASTLR